MPATTTAGGGRPAVRQLGTASVRDFAPGELAGWVRDRFEAGWRRLTVTDCSTGTRVGWIGRDPATGRRTWSAVDPWPTNPTTTTDIGD